MAAFVRPGRGELVFVPCKTGSTYLRRQGWPQGPWPNTEHLGLYRKYAVVRHPVERLISAVRMFLFDPECVGSVPGEWPGNTNEIIQSWYRDYGADRLEDPVRCAEHFVLNCLHILQVNQRPHGGDPHFWSQHLEWTQSGVGLWDIDVWLPTPYLSELAWIHLGVPRAPAANRGSAWRLPVSRKRLFTDTALARIHELYAVDFAVWQKACELYPQLDK